MSEPARIGKIRLKDGFTLDRLINGITGQGTRADPRTANRYFGRRLTPYEIASAYDGSGMMAKCIDIPALDMVRAWRDWQADKEQITALEAEEARLQIRQKIRMAETYRGLGGGALILGLPGASPASPAPAKINKGGLSYIYAVSRFQLTCGPVIDDYRDPNFGKPSWFRMNTTLGQVELHPSRVIMFPGDPVAELVTVTDEGRLWGRSRVERMMEAVQNSDSTNGAFAGLVTKVRNVIIGIPNLLDETSTLEGEQALQRRLQALVMGESLYNATLRDAGDGQPGAGETIEHRQVNWAGIPDVMMAMVQFISAISDIPATRLLGRSPDGQNSTGKSDTDNWNKAVKAKQELELGPCVDELDRYLIPSALGSRPPEIYYEWAPLDVPTEAEKATVFKTTMEAVEKVQNTGAIPERAFAEAFQNTLVEGGYMPGLDGALAAIPEAERFGIVPDDGGGSDDPSALQAEGGDPSLAGSGGSGSGAARRAKDATTWLADATPRPLYVQRKLLNAADLIDWAKANGFVTTLPASDMHVTVLYSRAEVDPMKMGRDWREDDKGEIIVRPGGPRVIERLGENAVVLRFACPDLDWRHRDMIEAGGSHDWPEYTPHVTISYAAPEGVDLEATKPFNGLLRFGPEIFEALDLDWKSKIIEDGGSRNSGRPFEDSNRNRYPAGSRRGGQFAPKGGGSIGAAQSFAASVKAKRDDTRVHTVGQATNASAIRLATGHDVAGFIRQIPASGVQHALKGHGAGSPKLKPGERPVRARDIGRVAHRLGDATTISARGKISDGSGVRFEHRVKIGNRTAVYIERMGRRDKQLRFVTMWWEK